MKSSVVITTLNEQDHILPLLQSLTSQTQPPAEIIIVDAGSTDNTLSLIKTFRKRHPDTMIRIIVSKRINRSVGRNLGITKAKHNLIAITDAGCIPNKDWLATITQPIRDKKADAVAGFYHPIATNLFQQCLAPFVAVLPSNYDRHTFLPSSRSIALTKEAWKKAGRYPKHLNYCEDLIFARNLKQKIRMVAEPKAIVRWHLPPNLTSYFKTIKNYAAGDIQAQYRAHINKIITVYLRYLAFILIKPLFLAYLFWPIFKHRHQLNHPFAALYLPLIQLTTDAAIITGSLHAFILAKDF